MSASPEEIAGCLAKARAVVGVSRKRVAADLGVSEKTLYTWETGKAMPTLDKAARLAELYGVSLDELVGAEELAGNARYAELRARVEELARAVTEIQQQASSGSSSETG